jgi:hypothetical protein
MEFSRNFRKGRQIHIDREWRDDAERAEQKNNPFVVVLVGRHLRRLESSEGKLKLSIEFEQADAVEKPLTEMQPYVYHGRRSGKSRRWHADGA